MSNIGALFQLLRCAFHIITSLSRLRTFSLPRFVRVSLRLREDVVLKGHVACQRAILFRAIVTNTTVVPHHINVVALRFVSCQVSIRFRAVKTKVALVPDCVNIVLACFVLGQ
jgi:hypothetical protein